MEQAWSAMVRMLPALALGCLLLACGLSAGADEPTGEALTQADDQGVPEVLEVPDTPEVPEVMAGHVPATGQSVTGAAVPVFSYGDTSMEEKIANSDANSQGDNELPYAPMS